MISKYKILITGKNPKYFLNKLINYKIYIYDIEYLKDGIKVIINEKDYEKIIKIKTTYKINIINRYGFIKYKYLINKYIIFIISIIISLILLKILSSMIFNIEVIHNDERIRNIIINDLSDKGIKKFHFKVSYKDKEKIKSYILNKEKKDIEWLEIETHGTKYIVRVEQRKINKVKKECTSQNIIAKKDAMILSISAKEGEVLKKKLDYVKKGDVIISGLIYNKETIVNKKCAKGIVYGEVWYKVTLELPKNYKEEILTGNTQTQIDLVFLNKNYNLTGYKTYQKKQYNLIKSNIIPFSINLTKYLETKVYKEKYNIYNIEDKAIKLASKKLKYRINDDSYIMNKKVLKKYEKNSKIIVEVFFKVKENITEIENIDNINIEEENKKISSKE